MNIILHPVNIINRKLDSVVKSAPFFFQNIGLRYFNCKLFFFSVKITSYSYIQINLLLEDELFSKYFFRNMTRCFDSYNLCYFLNGEGSVYPSVCNLKYFGKEFFICNNLQLNKLANKIILNIIQTKKINARTFSLLYKEILTNTTNPSIFSTIMGLYACNLKSILNNDECSYSSFFLEKIALTSAIKKHNTVIIKRKKTSFFSIILLEIYDICSIGATNKNSKFWFRFNVKNKYAVLKNFIISNKVKQNTPTLKMHEMDFIFPSNWNDEKYNFYFLKLKTFMEWVKKEIIQGLKENDLSSKYPTSLDNFFFVQKKTNSLIFSVLKTSLKISFEMFEHQIFNYFNRLNFDNSQKNWKKQTLSFENDFNKLIFKISNSAFTLSELNFTSGTECSVKNSIVFNGFQSQKIYGDNLNLSKNFKLSHMEIYRNENLRNYSFSLGRSSNYSKF